MKKIAGLVVIGMLLVLCLMSKAEARLRLSVGPFSPNLEEINRDLGEVNKEFGTNLRFEEDGLMYSTVSLSRFSPKWSRGIDISFYQTKTADSFDIIAGDSRIEGDFELGLIAVPIFLTRVYQSFFKGRLGILSPYYLGVGVGTVFTIIRVSREDKVTYPDGYTEENSWKKELISTPLAGQVLVGVEYRWSWTGSIFLEARYIVSNKAKILDREGGIETGVDWSGFSYRIGLMISL